MNRFSLLFVGLLSCLSGLQAASVDSLQGSYVNLPAEWRELLLLHGAIALETGMLKRLYSMETYPSGYNNARQLVHDLFYIVPESTELKLSKKIIEDKNLSSTIIPNIITNIAVLDVLEKARSAATLDTEYKNQIIKSLEKQLKKIEHATQRRFSSVQTEIAIAILSGALWYIKKTMAELDFDYQGQLTSAFTKIQEELKKINQKKYPQALSALFQPALDTTENNQLSAEDYETRVIETLKLLLGTANHPEKLDQVGDANITIDNNSYQFPDCAETALRNLINMFAYNRQTEKLSAKTIQNQFPNAHTKLIEFYTKYPDMSVIKGSEKKVKNIQMQITTG